METIIVRNQDEMMVAVNELLALGYVKIADCNWSAMFEKDGGRISVEVF